MKFSSVTLLMLCCSIGAINARIGNIVSNETDEDVSPLESMKGRKIHKIHKKQLARIILIESEVKENLGNETLPNQFAVDMSDLFIATKYKESQDLIVKLTPDMEFTEFKNFAWKKHGSTDEVKLWYGEQDGCRLNLVLSKSKAFGNLQCLDGYIYDFFSGNGKDGVVEVKHQNDFELTFPPYFVEESDSLLNNTFQMSTNVTGTYDNITNYQAENEGDRRLRLCNDYFWFWAPVHCSLYVSPIVHPTPEITVLILYTEDAIDDIQIPMKMFVTTLESDLNTILSKSGTTANPLNLRAIVKLHETPILTRSEIGTVPGLPGVPSKDYFQLLRELRIGGETNTGYFAHVFALRNSYKADFVTLLYGDKVARAYGRPFDGGIAGIGTVNRIHEKKGSVGRGEDPTKVYTIVRTKFALNQHGFVHELGHCFGLMHPNEFHAGNDDRSEDDTGMGFYKESKTYPNNGGKSYITTIMGYEYNPLRRQTGDVMLYFSNPNLSVKTFMGKVALGSPKRNAVKHIQDRSWKYAKFREHHLNYEAIDETDLELLTLSSTVDDNPIRLKGNTYASCQGEYTYSHDKVSGTNIWDGVNNNRFIFRCPWNAIWCITGSQWRQNFIDGGTGSCGAFICSKDSARNWFEADWSNNGGAYVSYSYYLHGSTYASCKGEYTKSAEKVFEEYIWIGRGNQRFIFRCPYNGVWAITSTYWKDDFIEGKITHCEAFIWSSNSASEWYLANWQNNNGAVVSSSHFY